MLCNLFSVRNSEVASDVIVTEKHTNICALYLEIKKNVSILQIFNIMHYELKTMGLHL